MKDLVKQLLHLKQQEADLRQQELNMLRDLVGVGEPEMVASFLNNSIFSNSKNPLQATIVNSSSVPVNVSNINDLRSITTITGKVFGSTTDFLTAGNNQNIVAVLTNPAGSSVDLAISLVTLATLNNVTNQRDIRNGTIAGTLTTNTIYNLNSNFSNSTTTTFRSAGGSGIDLTGGTVMATRSFSANTTNIFDFASAIVIKPGDSYGIKFNFSAGGTASINIIWEERTR
ncbi:hypothetical protein [Paenibacillus tyrfis]|uniref:hypothetical protein n=1 Tax=Paenibacillus tyrfis TaxID=1501230 RepID=UPI0020A1D228|nr:hypothetical protein [Paenibacillus tyrfis]MCP1310590.1 hypothetical protein [Paenibacillus tyrfis]